MMRGMCVWTITTQRYEMAEEVRENFEAVIGPQSGEQDRINTQAAYLIVMLLNMDISAEDKAVEPIDSLLRRLEFETQIHHKTVHERVHGPHANAKPRFSAPVLTLAMRDGERGRVGNAGRPRLKDTL